MSELWSTSSLPRCPRQKVHGGNLVLGPLWPPGTWNQELELGLNLVLGGVRSHNVDPCHRPQCLHL